MKEYKVGILGFGTVGAGVADCLLNNADVIAKRTGIKPVLAGIADLDITTDRGIRIPAGLLTTDASELIHHVDVVVELIGGTTVAKKFILQALGEGKSVVTANKALLAEHGEELFAAPEKTMPTCIMKPVSAAAFRSSRVCAKDSSATASNAFTVF